MKRSPALSQSFYWYQFNPCMAELTHLNRTYKEKVVDATIHHTDREYHHDLKREKADSYSGQNNAALQREFEALQLEKRKLQTLEAEIRDRIEFLVKRVYSMHSDMADDLNCEDCLSLNKYKEFLLLFKDAIAGSNNISCYKNKPYDEIMLAIEKYFPEATKN